MEFGNMVVNMAEFQKDLKSGMSIAECCKTHSIELKDIMQYLVAHNKKQTHLKNKKPRKNPNRNIYFKGTRWYLEKRSGGVQGVIATFKELEDARTVRDELEKCKWDLSQLDKILEQHNIHALPKYCILVNNNAYIQDSGYGTFVIKKGIKFGDVWRWVFYGTYSTIEDARAIRDELIKCNWDKTQLEDIKLKLGITDSKGR
ncbi:MAG: hypothetical protein UHM08_09000 [Bacteroidales bacterium]|nr:hypothetical protein [Bacteroidales bacterium]